MAMNKHQNLAQHNDPYKDQPTSGGTGGTRNKMSGGGHVHHGSHGHSHMHEHSESHGHKEMHHHHPKDHDGGHGSHPHHGRK